MIILTKKKVYYESEFLIIYEYSQGVFLLYIFTSINWPLVNEKLNWWYSVHTLTTVTSDHKKIWASSFIIYARYWTFDIRKIEVHFLQSQITSVNADRCCSILLWSLVRVVNMFTEFQKSRSSIKGGQFIEVKKKRTLRIIVDYKKFRFRKHICSQSPEILAAIFIILFVSPSLFIRILFFTSFNNMRQIVFF